MQGRRARGHRDHLTRPARHWAVRYRATAWACLPATLAVGAAVERAAIFVDAARLVLAAARSTVRIVARIAGWTAATVRQAACHGGVLATAARIAAINRTRITVVTIDRINRVVETRPAGAAIRGAGVAVVAVDRIVDTHSADAVIDGTWIEVVTIRRHDAAVHFAVDAVLVTLAEPVATTGRRQRINRTIKAVSGTAGITT